MCVYMKILLYAEGLDKIGKSGLGKAIQHQEKALQYEKIPYTFDVEEDYDILHINTYFFQSYLLAKKAKKNHKKIVYHAHSTEEDYKDGFVLGHLTSKMFKKWIVKCYQLGDVLITPTPYSKKLLESYEGLEDKKIYDISNGIDLDFWTKDETRRKKFRKNITLERKIKSLLVSVFIFEEKELLILLSLPNDYQNINLFGLGKALCLLQQMMLKKL